MSEIQALIPVNYENAERPTVSGRDLHEFLGMNSNYTTWFNRMAEYGFAEHEDYESCFPNLESENRHGGQNKVDHQLTIPMAKELCMIQRNERGKQARQYFLEIERKWNSPEDVMRRAFLIAQKDIEKLKHQVICLEQTNDRLEETVAVQNQQITELKPKATYYDICLQTTDAIAVSIIAKDYGWSASRMNKELADRHVQYKQGKIWLLYQKHAERGYTVTKTSMHTDKNGDDHSQVHTYWTQKGRLFIYDLFKQNGILPLIERE